MGSVNMAGLENTSKVYEKPSVRWLDDESSEGSPEVSKQNLRQEVVRWQNDHPQPKPATDQTTNYQIQPVNQSYQYQPYKH